MAELSAMWVDGNAGVPQDQLSTWKPWGGGPLFHLRQGDELWVHVPIPTPVLLKGLRATLRRVHVLYWTYDQFTWLDSVHIREGQGRFAPHDGLQWSGEHRTSLGAQTTIEVGWDGIAWGIGLSLRFAVSSIDGGGDFQLAGAGADFEHDW